MEERKHNYLYLRLVKKNHRLPVDGFLELTYFCNLNCLHCYVKGSERPKQELSTSRWKSIIQEIKKAGCMYLVFTGGDPLARDDFLELYTYAKRQGFIITIFTNGIGFTDKMIKYLAKSPPYYIDLTLNGITPETYETITQVKGSFKAVMENIEKIKRHNLPLRIKVNCMQENKHEIMRIKDFAMNLLGASKGQYLFAYDVELFPRLNGDKSPLAQRLSVEEVGELIERDSDMRNEYARCLDSSKPGTEENAKLYKCNAWSHQFFINPFGRLKFCQLTDKFSVDLLKMPFKQGFYREFPKVADEKFKTDSECRTCSLRNMCISCPAKAYLEAGNEESPVEYYCQLAKRITSDMKGSLHGQKEEVAAK
ncbi:MAG: radical SAM protein [Candidatus Omnitrophica bacterium]|nr:radical SAM protein [Candidatus Omnitrophota bacterium]